MIKDYIEDDYNTSLEVYFNHNDELVISVGERSANDCEVILLDEEMCDWLIDKLQKLKPDLKQGRKTR